MIRDLIYAAIGVVGLGVSAVCWTLPSLRRAYQRKDPDQAPAPASEDWRPVAPPPLRDSVDPPIRHCSRCHALTDVELCPDCADRAAGRTFAIGWDPRDPWQVALAQEREQRGDRKHCGRCGALTDNAGVLCFDCEGRDVPELVRGTAFESSLDRPVPEFRNELPLHPSPGPLFVVEDDEP